jgi:hypothetical protein
VVAVVTVAVQALAQQAALLALVRVLVEQAVQPQHLVLLAAMEI